MRFVSISVCIATLNQDANLINAYSALSQSHKYVVLKKPASGMVATLWSVRISNLDLYIEALDTINVNSLRAPTPFSRCKLFYNIFGFHRMFTCFVHIASCKILAQVW